MKRYTVYLSKYKPVRVLAESPRYAAGRAVEKLFGKDAYWWGPTLEPWRIERNDYEYGQVAEYLPKCNASTCRTPQLRIEVLPGWRV